MDITEVSTMKPSEALFAGIKLVKPSKHGDCVYLTAVCGCALGTLVVGAMGRNPMLDANPTERRALTYFPHLDSTYAEHPIYGTTKSLWLIINSLFENYGWSRRKIAFWLKGIGQ
jgi:hypothetical protein